MEFLDIAVASGYAAVCLSLVLLMNPLAPHEAAVDAATQSRLDSAISAYVDSAGLPFLAYSPEGAVCASASNASNSTLTIDILLDGRGCASLTPGAPPLASSSLSLHLPGRDVVIEAWLARR